MEHVIRELDLLRLKYKRSANYFIAEGLPGNAKHYLKLTVEYARAISVLKAENKSKA